MPDPTDTPTPSASDTRVVKRALSTCGTCGFAWPTGSDGSHVCSAKLSTRVTRLVHIFRNLLSDLPARRDWLDPALEAEIKAEVSNWLSLRGIESTAARPVERQAASEPRKGFISAPTSEELNPTPEEQAYLSMLWEQQASQQRALAHALGQGLNTDAVRLRLNPEDYPTDDQGCLTILRVYNNGDRMSQTLPADVALRETAYSRRMRPGCALFIGHVCVQPGSLSASKVLEITRELAPLLSYTPSRWPDLAATMPAIKPEDIEP